MSVVTDASAVLTEVRDQMEMVLAELGCEARITEPDQIYIPINPMKAAEYEKRGYLITYISGRPNLIRRSFLYEIDFITYEAATSFAVDLLDIVEDTFQSVQIIATRFVDLD